jgi:hypothetical protein
MRRILHFSAVVALAVVGLSSSAGADPDARPFGGTVTGGVDFAPAPECPIGLKTVSDGVGTFSHMGLTVMHSEHCTPMGDYVPLGHMTLTAANGDMVVIEYNSFAPFPTPGTEVIHAEGDFVIVDGTGRFAGATGGQFDSDLSTFNYVADLEFPGFGPDGFPLPGPWPTVWTFGPTTIGY